ncbi:carboxylesterase family protein, partial [Corynebacterium sp.]
MPSDTPHHVATTTGRTSNHWVVETTTGPVKGHPVNRAIAFRGIPYAEQPTGDLRFRRATEKQPWRGVLLAERSGDYCSQWCNPKVGWIGSEHCLWL